MKKLRHLQLPPVSYACEFRARCNRLVPIEQYNHFMTKPLTGEVEIVCATRDRLCDARPLMDLPFEFYDHLALNTFVTGVERRLVAPYQVAFSLAHVEFGVYSKRFVPVAAALALLLMSAADYPRMLPEPGLADSLECLAPIEPEEQLLIEACVPIARIVEHARRPARWDHEVARHAKAATGALNDFTVSGPASKLWGWLCEPRMIVRTHDHGMWQF